MKMRRLKRMETLLDNNCNHDFGDGDVYCYECGIHIDEIWWKQYWKDRENDTK